MKLYRVVTEQDGPSHKDEERQLVTKILRSEYRYAADSIQEVWDEIEWLRIDPEITVIALIEDAPSVTVVHRHPQEDSAKEGK